MRIILLLGAAVWADGPSPTLRRRTEHAARLYHAGRAEVIVACGGAGATGDTEAATAARLLRELGVPEKAIRLEDTSRTTWENIAHALPICRDIGATDILLVSDRYHLPRARLAAWRLGVHARGNGPGWDGTARRHRLSMILRELPALVKYALGPRPNGPR
ncbi:YdcF family protein [Roseisalinus antarcticus]|uniref:DUF218 domain-containing protein n=1 Tax=Roseisalinus antarcticus TaxID=254357 RepID=A0A1Y5T3I1_9RHOB|nr:YdcF family protein [Roseisalinus antarcticus]SLN51468.1 hypothetical protein ROA7023_02258 [Roseisalinus antarcticus]